MAKAGDKIICTDDSGLRGRIKKGSIHTIKEIHGSLYMIDISGHIVMVSSSRFGIIDEKVRT